MADQQEGQEDEVSIDNEQEATALTNANLLNTSLLHNDLERTYLTLKTDHDLMTKTCSSQQTQISKLQADLERLQGQLSERDGSVNQSEGLVEVERRKREVSEEETKRGQERMARMEIEADSLFQQISRLTNTNNSLNTQLTELKASTTLTTSSTTPLQYEITRLQSELDSLNAHSKWLESELNTRSTQNTELKLTNTKTIQKLTKELEVARQNEETSRLDLSSVTSRYEANSKKVESMDKELMEKEQHHADSIHELEVEIQTERRLVSLTKENAARMEDRYKDAMREIESMKELARTAMREHEEQMEVLTKNVENEAMKAMEGRELQWKNELEEAEKRLQNVLEEKTRLEDSLMSSSEQTKHITRGGKEGASSSLMQIEYTAADGKPQTLTDVYDQMSDAQDEARREKAARQKAELLLERLQREIELTMPKRRQERREYEVAIKQANDIQERLREALKESVSTKDALRQKQREEREIEEECRALRLENEDLARQVQSLLQKSIGVGAASSEQFPDDDIVTFGSAEELQNQNQRLLREHHRLVSQISELEEKFDNDTNQARLVEAEASLKELREERENQAALVASIVQQRDLYRALLAKNDASLLAAKGAEGGALVAAKDQIEKYTEVDGKNKELLENISKLKTDLSTSKNNIEGLEERLARSDAYASGLSDSMIKLQSEVSAAHAATARSNAELSYKVKVIERQEESLDRSKRDIAQITNSKHDLQKVSEDLQSNLSKSIADLAQLEEELRSATVQKRLLETKVQTLQAAETRLVAENHSLRSDMAKHGALHESMQKIETSVSARADEDRERINEEMKRLSDLLSSERSKHSTQVEALQNKVIDVDNITNALKEEKEEALSQTIKAKDEAANLQKELQTVKTKCDSLEEALNAAKIQLGDEDVDTSDKDKVKVMTVELNSLKEDLSATRKKAEDYQSIAKANEKALVDSTNAIDLLKEKYAKESEAIKKELTLARQDAKVKQEALDEITEDLTSKDQENEKMINELRAKNEALTIEINSEKENCTSAKNQLDTLSKEIGIYKADAAAATDNYERELALHASARTILRDAREEVDTESSRRQKLESELNSIKGEISKERASWEETKASLENVEKDISEKLKDAKKQNEILHSQIATLSDTVEKYQSGRIAKFSEGGDLIEKSEDDATSELSSLQKQVSELREVVRFMRSEKEMLDSQLLSARRSTDRERAAKEVTKRSLEQARAELILMQKKGSDGGLGGDTISPETIVEAETKMKQSHEQVVIMRESNKLLREETEKLRSKVDSLQKEIEESKNEFEPTDKKCRQLEVDKAALEAEKASLSRDVDSWKNRVQSLVSKFHQIDPEEHSNALAKMEQLKKESENLLAAKTQAEKERSSAKALVVRLNKDVSKQKELVESTKSSLEKVIGEKAALIKFKNEAAKTSKEIEELKKSKADLEAKLNTSKIDVDAKEKRVENLTRMLRVNRTKFSELQQKMQTTTQKEQETKALLTKEKEARSALLKEQESLKKALKGKQEVTKDSLATSSVSAIGTQPQSNSSETSKATSKTVVSEVSEHKTNDSKKESISQPEVDITAEIPKVPSEGFKFAPSPVATPSVSASSVDGNNKDGANVKKQTITDKSEKVQSTMPAKQDCEAPKKKEEASSKEPSSSKTSDPSQATTQATTQATPSNSGKLNTGNASTAVNSAPASKEDVLREKIMKKKRKLALAEMKVKSASPVVTSNKRERVDSAVSTSTSINVPTSNVQEDNQASDLTAQVTKSISNPTGSTVTNPPKGKSEEEQAETNEKKSSEVPSEQLPPTGSKTMTSFGKTASGPKTTASFGNTSTVSFGNSAPMQSTQNPFGSTKGFGSSASASSQKASSEPKTMLGQGPFSGSAKGFGEAKSSDSKTTIGQTAFPGSSIGFGFQPAVNTKPKTDPKTSTGFPSGGGAFLNLQPPGSGQAKPLVFGSSANIKLPTPSKMSVIPQPFGAFGQPKPSTGNQVSLFAPTTTAANKKRGHQDEDNGKSTKVARVDATTEESKEGKGEVSADKKDTKTDQADGGDKK